MHVGNTLWEDVNWWVGQRVLGNSKSGKRGKKAKNGEQKSICLEKEKEKMVELSWYAIKEERCYLVARSIIVRAEQKRNRLWSSQKV